MFLALSLSLTSCTKEEVVTDPIDTTNNNNNNGGTNTTTLSAEEKAFIDGLLKKYTNGEVTLTITHAESDAPYKADQKIKFTFGSSGKLMIDVDPSTTPGTDITINSFTKASSGAYIWKDAANDLEYALSLKPNTTDEINEFNITKTSTSKFLNQASVKPDGNGGTTVDANSVLINGNKLEVTDFLPLSIAASDTWSATGTVGTSDSMSVLYKVDEGARPTSSISVDIKPFALSTGVASISLIDTDGTWYAQSGKINFNPETDGTIKITFSDITFGDTFIGTPTKTKTISLNGSVAKEYKSTFSLNTLGWNYTSAIAPTILDNNSNTSAGVAGVNKENKSGSVQCYFKTGGLKAGTYKIVHPHQTTVGTSTLDDVTKVADDEVHVSVLSYKGTTTNPTQVLHYGQSGTLTVEINNGEFKISFSNIPAKAKNSDDDSITGLIEGKI